MVDSTLMASPVTRTAILWLEPDQLNLLQRIVADAGLRVVGVGSPVLGRAAELAAAFDAHALPLDDLRQALTSVEGDLFLLASIGDFGRTRHAASASGTTAHTGIDDCLVLDQRRNRGTLIVSFEPLPASILDLAMPAPSGGVGLPVGSSDAEQAGVVLGQQSSSPVLPVTSAVAHWAAFIPLFRLGPSMRAAADVIAHLGPLHTVAAEFVSGAGEGPVGSRVFDAVEAITSLLGEPDSVDASYVWPGRGKVVHPVPDDSLRGLQGAIAASMRYADGRAATLLAADSHVGSGRWSRTLTMIGDGGRLRVHDRGFEFVSADGKIVDRSAELLQAHTNDESAAASLFAHQLNALLDPHTAGRQDQPIDYARVLSVAGAALLSARTAEPESPGTILRMARTT